MSNAIRSICDEFSIEIIGKSAYPMPGQTRAPTTLERILRRHGEAHLRLVLTTLRETANNHVLLDEVSLWAASDMIRACQTMVDAKAGDWLNLWDEMPVGQLQALCEELSGVVPQRYALGGMIYERVHRRFGPNAAQPDLFDDRRRK